MINVPGDADVDIVKTVVDSSPRHSTTLPGEDNRPIKIVTTLC